MHDQRLDNLLSKYHHLRAQGQAIFPAQLCSDCPELLDAFQKCAGAADAVQATLDLDTPPCDDAGPADAPDQAPTNDTAARVASVPQSAGDPFAADQGALAQQGANAEPARVDSQKVPSPGPNVPGYEVLGELGRGGMGVVYKARHQTLQRLVALKMIRSGASAGSEELQRFRTEAEAIARLQHANIVQIFEVGEYGHLPFFALEYCAGGSLDKKLAGTPLPPQEAATLVEKLALSMHAAHSKGILHRDLKPANVLLADDDTPKITDFGLAKMLDVAGQTSTGAVVGTPSYMAPEQASGQSKTLGPTCDIYALGAILYECLTGRPPFKAATALDTLLQVVRDEPVPPRQLNPAVARDLETVCLKCLHKSPADRYATAQALADDLQRWFAGEPVMAKPLSLWRRADHWVRKLPNFSAVGIAIMICGTAFAAALPARWEVVALALTAVLAGYAALKAVPRVVALGMVGNAIFLWLGLLASADKLQVAKPPLWLAIAGPMLLAALISAWWRSSRLGKVLLTACLAGLIGVAIARPETVSGTMTVSLQSIYELIGETTARAETATIAHAETLAILLYVGVGTFALCGYARALAGHYAAPLVRIALGALTGCLFGLIPAGLVWVSFGGKRYNYVGLIVGCGMVVAGTMLGGLAGAARRRGGRSDFGVYPNPGFGPVVEVHEFSGPQLRFSARQLRQMADLLDRHKQSFPLNPITVAGKEVLAAIKSKPSYLAILAKARQMLESKSSYVAILAKGRQEGRLQGKQTILLRLGRKRFGEPDDATQQHLLAISDVERLDALGERMLKVGSWQELLAQP